MCRSVVGDLRPRLLNDLAAQLLDVADRVSKSGSNAVPTDHAGVSDPTRNAATVCGIEVAGEINRYWDAPIDVLEGPIDVIDMFSGSGGMSAGFKAANSLLPAFRLAAAVDVDHVANQSYEANLGLQPVNADVAALARSKTRLGELLSSSSRREGHPLILIGCAPCQGFSSHRNDEGQTDERNSLFVDFAKVAIALRPDIVVVENVPELLTTKYWRYVEKARALLEGSGYFVYLGVHNMAEFGVPQERFRALLLAMPKHFRRPSGFLGRESFRTVRNAIAHLPPIHAGEQHRSDPMHYTAKHRESTLQTIRAVPKNGGSRPTDVGPECLSRMKERQGRAAYEDIYGRLHWDRPAITITAYARNPASGRFVHPEQDRGLSIREAALLQGFPRNYSFAGTLDPCFRQIGNAVPPIFASYLAFHLLGELLSPVPTAGFARGVREPVGSSFSRLIPALKAGNRRWYL